MSFVHGNCPLSGIRRFPLQRGLKNKSMLVSISALAFVHCVEVSTTERVRYMEVSLYSSFFFFHT